MCLLFVAATRPQRVNHSSTSRFRVQVVRYLLHPPTTQEVRRGSPESFLAWHFGIITAPTDSHQYLPLPYLRTDPDHQANACELGSSPPLTSRSHEQHPITRRRIRG